MAPELDADPLSAAAEAIARGNPVDWDHAEQSALDANAAKELAALRQVEAIARAHSTWATSEETVGLQNTQERKWRHLGLRQQLGRGAGGVVYLATDDKLGHDVAVKLIDPDRSAAEALREARMMTRVRHPHVVAVHGADADGGRVGVWMELIRGLTLEQILATQGPFGAKEAASIGVDLCGALAAVHRAGLVHRDVKARNVMREHGGRIVLMDFSAGADLTTLDAHWASAAGTPLYAAPEAFDNAVPSPVADIYSAGVLLYHLVTGSYPVVGATLDEIRVAHRRGQRRRLRDARPELPEPFVSIVERALSMRPEERQQTAGALGDDLAACFGEKGRPPAWSREPTSWRAVVGAGAVVAVLAGAAWCSTRSSAPAPSRAGAAIERAAAPAPGPIRPYEIEAQFLRENSQGEAPLDWGQRLTPGDRLTLSLRTSVEAHVYVINQDDQGQTFLLFPLQGQALTNPLPAGTLHRIPGQAQDGSTAVQWQVTSAGGREHFFVLASPEPQELFEQMIASLPRPRAGAVVTSALLPPDAVGMLRGVGGLASATVAQMTPLRFPGAKPLARGRERVEGLFARQISFDNPPANAPRLFRER